MSFLAGGAWAQEFHGNLYLGSQKHRQAVGIEITSQQMSSTMTQPECINLTREIYKNKAELRPIRKNDGGWGVGKRNPTLETSSQDSELKVYTKRKST